MGQIVYMYVFHVCWIGCINSYIDNLHMDKTKQLDFLFVSICKMCKFVK